MRKLVFALVAVFGLAALAQAQATAEGGWIVKSATGSYSTWGTDQALNSMADWYTMKRADSIGVVVATKYGTSYRLKGIKNSSGTAQTLLVITVNGTDTVPLGLGPYEFTGKLPAIKKVISGAVVDSTTYFFQRQ